MKRTPLNKVSKTEVAKLIKRLVTISHTYIRRRDSFNKNEIRGKCFDCILVTEGAQFQCGHFIADGRGGALLRFHPHNMHGQAGGCNMVFSQERVKINYTLAMINKYGKSYVEKLLSWKYKQIDADVIFYTKMIELYEKGIEADIVDFLESLAK